MVLGVYLNRNNEENVASCIVGTGSGGGMLRRTELSRTDSSMRSDI